MHEWLDQRSGSENTFRELARAFPDATLFALTRNPSVEFEVDERPVHTTWIDHRGVRDRRALELPLMPIVWRTTAVRQRFDVVITSTHAFGKAFRPARHAVHFNYCHTPMRYAWLPETDDRVPGAIRPFTAGLRSIDRRDARTVDHFAANSHEVADRIARFYGRTSIVIAPPVDVGSFEPVARPSRDFLLAAGRLVPYKRTDIAIRSALLAGIPIVVAGDGPERAKLEETFGHEPSVSFEGRVSQVRLRHLMSNALALVFCAFEDFGITPLEAQAAGTPVLAYGRGGALDTVVEGTTGLLVPTQTAEDFAVAIQQLRAARWDPAACRAHALSFEPTRFRREIRSWVDTTLDRDS